jgi:hypothetical protein
MSPTDHSIAMSEPPEHRVSRLSISIGAHLAKIANPQDQEKFLAEALIEVLEDLIRRGEPLDKAAELTDDIIAGARIIATRLMVGS